VEKPGKLENISFFITVSIFFYHDSSCGKSTRVPLFIFEDADKHNKVTKIQIFKDAFKFYRCFVFIFARNARLLFVNHEELR
jgi:hypothetical protein